MGLQQRKRMDRGEVGFSAGNQEVIDSAFSLLIAKLPEEKRKAIENTYKELVDEHKQFERDAMEEYMKEKGIVVLNTNSEENDEDKQKAIDDEQTAKERLTKASEVMDIIQQAPSQGTKIEPLPVAEKK